jgi:hypothetical protein
VKYKVYWAGQLLVFTFRGNTTDSMDMMEANDLETNIKKVFSILKLPYMEIHVWLEVDKALETGK